MGIELREIKFSRTLGLDHYRAVDGLEEDFETAVHLGSGLADELGPRRVWMLGLAEHGSSESETIPALCRLIADTGVDCRWMVVECDDERFYQSTEILRDMMRGEDGPDPAGDVPGLEERRPIYDGVLEETADELQKHVDPLDVVIVHGAALAGVGRFLPEGHRGRLIWVAREGGGRENEASKEAWSFLRPYLEVYARCLFPERRFIPSFLRDRSGVVTPGIDPLSHKNRLLRPYKLAGVLRSSGLVERPQVPEWAHFKGEIEVLRGNSWKKEPLLNPFYRPLVVQVSRFETMKGFVELLDGFHHLLKVYPERIRHMKVDEARISHELDEAELILAGPDPEKLPYSSGGKAALRKLMERHSALPPEIARRVHVLKLPLTTAEPSAKENHLTVNALQRMASVYVQCSLDHGFGLTVLEALWKGVPVVASDVGGIGHRLRDGVDGTLIADPRDPESVAMAILEVFADRRSADVLSRSGHKRVAESHLILQHVVSMLEEIGAVAEGEGALRPRPVEKGKTA